MKRPVYTNRGVVTPLSGSKQTITDFAFFDAYSASIETCPFELQDDLERVVCTAMTVQGEYHATGKLKYYGENRAFLTNEGRRLFNIQFGGSNGKPLVQCTGAASDFIASALRGHKEPHKPVRIDSALDVAGSGLFERIEKMSKRLAGKHGVSWRPVGDWATPEAGRTIEIGSRRSEVYFRIYEKGFEMQAKHRVELDTLAKETVRIEVEFKPRSKAAKKLAPKITPPELFALNRTLREFIDGLVGEELQSVLIQEPKTSDRDKSLRWMMRQYGGQLDSLLNDCGGDLAEFASRLFDIGRIIHDKH